MISIPHVTPQPWAARLQHPSYGAPDTYRLAAAWLAGCATVADWGGSTGALKGYLYPAVDYRVIDGTTQIEGQVLADLLTYTEPSDGILLRHVLELNEDWRRILRNALGAFRQRMVVVTFLADVPKTQFVKHKTGWPIYQLSRQDVLEALGPACVFNEAVRTTHDEHVYYCERVR